MYIYSLLFNCSLNEIVNSKRFYCKKKREQYNHYKWSNFWLVYNLLIWLEQLTCIVDNMSN